MKSLQQELMAKKEELEGLLPAQFQESFLRAVRDLQEQQLRKNALTVGDWAPDFALKTPNGQLLEPASWLRTGPLVVTFYLGSWSPYCVLQLKAFQRQLFQIRGLGGQLVAISPESAESGLATSLVHRLQYPLLSDRGGAVAKQFGLQFTVPEYLRIVYDRLGVDLPAHNRDDSFALPLPATFVIDQEGRIAYAYVQEDFSQRASIRDILTALYDLRSQRKLVTRSQLAGTNLPLNVEAIWR
jgi:peroxiredoxin